MNKQQENLLTEAKLVMLRRMPYYGTFVIGVPLLPDPSVPTACTNYTEIKYNPDWLLGGGADGKPLRNRDEVVFVLGHEVLHMSFKHGIRMGFREPRLWNVACMHGDTLVTLQSGQQAKIKDIRGGHVIRSPLGPNTVHMVTRSTKRDMVNVGIQFRPNIKATNDHLFLTTEGFKKAGDLRIGDHVIVETENGMDRQHSSSDNAGGVGVHGGDSGRGGNHLGSPSHGEGPSVLSASHLHLDHVSGVGRVGRGNGDVRDRREELERTVLLESYGFRLGDRVVSSWDAATFADQETARGIAARLHQSAAPATQDLCAVARDNEAVLRDQGFERARVTDIRPYVEDTEVYDLITERHSYVAGGAVVHNCDYAINLILHEGEVGKMPEMDASKGEVKLLDERFKGMSAETIYDILEKENQKQNGGKAGGKLKMGGGVIIDLSKDDPGGTGGFEKPKNVDGSDLSPAQMQELERDVDAKTSASAAAAKSQGKLPAGLERFIKGAMKPEVDWRERLRMFVSKQFPTNQSWAKPNRRHLWQDLYLPYTEKTGVGEIMVVLDTSGSISFDNPKSEGAQFYAEVRAIFEDVMPSKLRVVYCDAEVAGHDVFEQGEEPMLKPRGGGGTDFRPPFKMVDREGLDIQCLIYLSDLYGSFPDQAAPYPVMWVSTTDVVAPWGETIRIMKHQ